MDQSCAVVTDDGFIVRMDASDMLEDAGFTALPAAGADQALDLLQERHEEVQLLFTDVHMPGSSMDGFALARRVAGTWSHTRIIVASGNAHPDQEDMPPDARFIGKPFSAALVQSVLQEMLEDGRKPEPLRRKADKES